MSSRKTLKSVSVEGLKPAITLTPVIETCGEGCRIHHIKSDSIARDGRDTFVPLRHVSKQKRRIFELEEENDKLREILKSLMMGTNAELCAGRGESDCKECSMYHGEDGCTVVNAMELLGIDMYGEPLGIEVDG